MKQQTLTLATATLADVLRASPAEPVRFIKPAKVDSGSVQATIIERAARQVRDIYLDGIRRVKYDEKQPEVFFDACFDTWSVFAEVEQAVQDDATAAIALAILERAGWNRDGLRPTTLEAQVRMQMTAIDAATQAKVLFAKQAELSI